MRLHVPVPVRWGDLDAYGHVNNVAVLGFLEEARIAAFWRHPDAAEQAWPTAILDAGPGSATVTVVARQEIEYLQPIDHRRDPLTVADPGPASRIAVGHACSAASGWRQNAAIRASSRNPSTATLLTCP